MIPKRLIAHLRQHFALDWHGIHGSPHWARVRDNGLRLAERTGARQKVVELFAFLHDSCRQSDGSDPHHGRRAGQFARSLAGNLIEVDETELELLVTACEGHSNGGVHVDMTVATCWDADRLDLGRVGIKPDPARLCTEAARNIDLLEWAYHRSYR